MKKLLSVSLLLVNSLWITFCLANPLVSVQLADQTFMLEYVADPDSRRQGLMGRTSLPSDGGMLFDFPTGTQPQIWMRNMHISLDLLFVDKQGELVDIYHTVPPCPQMPCPLYGASRPLRFVLELPAGSAKELALQPGDRIALADVLQRPAPRY